MTRAVLKKPANEKSTYAVKCSFFTENDAVVVPDTVQWSLLTLSGAVINSRSNVSITPASQVTIVLSGNDLALLDGEIDAVNRVVTVLATYSSTAGSNLPLNEECEFTIWPIVGV